MPNNIILPAVYGGTGSSNSSSPASSDSIRSYDTVEDLKAAQPLPAKDSLAIVGTASKSFYIYGSSGWAQIAQTSLPALATKVDAISSKLSDEKSRMGVAETHLDQLKKEDESIRGELASSIQVLNNNIAQKPDGLTLTNEDGTSLADLTDIKLDGAEVVDNGDGTYSLKSHSKLSVANGQSPDSTSLSGNTLIFPDSTITADPDDENVLTVSVHAQSHGGINVGDGVNASRAVQTLTFLGHQAYGSGTEASIHIDTVHFKTIAERDAWSAKFGSKMTYDTVAVVDDDGDSFVGWFKFDAETKKWVEYDAQGVIIGDSNGFIPKNIKTIVLGNGLTAQQAGDQEDAVLITATGGGSSVSADLTVEQDWGNNASSNNVNAIQTLYPLEVNKNQIGSNPLQGNAALSISPSAYETQHGNSCLLKLNRVRTIGGQHPFAVYMSEEVVPTGEYFQLNTQSKGVDVQDNTGGDTAVTGGQMTEALVKLSFVDKAPDDGNVKVWLEYNDPSDLIAKNILTDVNGNPLAVEKNFKAGDDIGGFILAGAFMAKATQPLKVMVETSFDVNSKITLDPVNTMLCINQFSNGYETSIARIEFLRRAAVQITPSIQKFTSKMLALSNEITGINEYATTIEAGTGMDTLNEFGVQNLTEVSIEIKDDTMIVKDTGKIPDFYVDTLIDNTHTRMLRGKEIAAGITIANPDNAFEFEAYEWTGKPDHVTQVYSSRNNDSVVLNTGWKVIKGLFISEQPNGNSFGHVLTFTVPVSANNILILVRPHVNESPTTLKLSELDWGTTSTFTGYIEIERYNSHEDHLRFDDSYGEYFLTNEGFVSLRYTINNTPSTGNPMPVGKLVKGKAPIEIDNSVNKVSGSAVPQYDGAIKFLKDGEASISKSYNVWNEQGTDNAVTFWDILIDVDGNESKIPDSERTFTVPKNTGAPGIVYSIPAYAIDVEKGQRVGGRATSNKADGVYVQSQNVSEYLVQTVIELKELSNS